MKKKISKKEISLLEDLWANNSPLKIIFDQGIKDVRESFIEDLDQQYDKELFTEFMQKYLLEVFTINKDNIKIALQNVAQNKSQAEDNIAKTGSTGLTLLIAQYLNKISQKSQLADQDIKVLIDLINCRNQMQSAEKEYIENHYKQYLRSQILLISK